MEPNLAGSIYVRSSIKLLHLVPFGQQTWLPKLILFSDWLMLKKIFFFETAWPNGAKPGIDGPWLCPFQNCVRQPTLNTAGIGKNCLSKRLAPYLTTTSLVKLCASLCFDIYHFFDLYGLCNMKKQIVKPRHPKLRRCFVHVV